MAISLMVQGAGSNVGKSVIVTGLCRAMVRRGLNVCPFKPQNMSNNAAAVAEGAEIGRAQQLQAQACGIEAHADMNPVLLKPETETGAQIIVQGRRLTTVKARDYAALKPGLMRAVLESYGRLAARHDIVIVEGAGSAAETNLRRDDIANMGFARAAEIPVMIVGDIERGGVIAQLVGTKVVLDSADAELVCGFAINKFRGDPSLFRDGEQDIEARTGWPHLGTVPWLQEVRWLPSEDSEDLRNRPAERGGIRITCLSLPRIANFDDLDPLRFEPDISVSMLEPGQALPGDTDLVIVPGSKSTRADLSFLRGQGWDVDIHAHIRRGGHVLGICGGYQMLGKVIRDPGGIEGCAGEAAGLGLLDVETVMQAEKRVGEVTASAGDSRDRIRVYEIHIGQTRGSDTARPFATIEENGRHRSDGAVSTDGRISGTYLHGLFADDGFRKSWLRRIGARGGGISYRPQVEAALDSLAAHLEQHLQIDRIVELMRTAGTKYT
ncbi:MAG: cobyric acid synthase [Rhodobacteraceae bacterium]|nr:cobyric acid synthase [Paracoccaceae bacterium]